MARDPLRSTLDNLAVDPAAQSERPYLESALRRMGYTEAEIRERLGAPAPTARPTEYRLVKPVVAATKPTLQSPFEDLLPKDLEFSESPPVDFDAVEALNEEFQEVPVTAPAPEPAPEVLEEEPLEFEEFEVIFEEAVPAAAQAAKKGKGAKGLSWDETQAQAALDANGGEPLDFALEPASGQKDFAIDTFGSSESAADATAPRTRIRVRRVRAGSRSEAEAKVAGKGRRVIKSIPVDIVERWGPGESREKGAR